MSPVRARLRLPCRTSEEADRLAGAIRPDDDGFVRTRTDGAVVEFEIEAKNLRSLLRAVDDVLAASGISEDLLRPEALDE